MIDQFLRTGATIDVFDSAALAALDATGLTLGTRVYVTSLASDFTLKLSTAALVPDEVVAVAGIDGLRWIKDTGGGGGFSGFAAQYVAPSGNNLDPGTQGAPKKTGAAAYLALPDTGGTIYFASNSDWSDGTEGHGLVAGQGCRTNEWLGLVGLSIPQWLPYKPVVFAGYGLDNTEQFGDSTVKLAWGNNNDGKRRDPALWIVGTTVPYLANSISFVNEMPARIAWDYRRNLSDGSVAWANIDHAHRNGDGTTTFTLAAPAPYTLVSLSRTGGITTIEISNSPRYTPSPCIWPNMIVSLTTTDPNFTSGPKTVTEQVTQTLTTWTFKVSDAGPDVAKEAASGTLSGIGVGNKDIIEIESTNAQFVTSMYRVISVLSEFQVLAEDKAGTYGSRSPTADAANIGQWVVQDRSLNQGTALDEYDRCGFIVINAGNPEIFNNGPAMDRGCSTAGGWSWIRGGVMRGGQVNADVDPNRTAGLFASGGSSNSSGPSFQIRDTRISSGNIRIDNDSGLAQYTVDFVVSDTGNNYARPPVEFIGPTGGAGTIRAYGIQPSDSSQLYSIDFQGLPYRGVVVDSYPVTGLPPGNATVAIFGEQTDWQTATRSQPSRNAIGPWGTDNRLGGKRIDVQSSFGVVQNRNDGTNLAPADVTTWTKVGVTVTAGQSTARLDNSNQAYRLTGPGTISFDATVPVPADNDSIVFGVWAKPVGTGILNNNTLIVAGNIFQDLVLQIPPGVGGNGEWQLITGIGQVIASATGGSTTLHMTFSVASDYYIYLPTLKYFPISSVPMNEAYRFLETFVPIPAYLGAGVAGTFAGIPLVGHGGLGTNNAYVEGAGSGQLTIVGSYSPKHYEPILAADGVTVKGWAELIHATVNP